MAAYFFEYLVVFIFLAGFHFISVSNRINKIILDSGFSIIMKMVIQIHEDNTKSFYGQRLFKSFLASLIKYMTRCEGNKV